MSKIHRISAAVALAMAAGVISPNLIMSGAMAQQDTPTEQSTTQSPTPATPVPPAADVAPPPASTSAATPPPVTEPTPTPSPAPQVDPPAPSAPAPVATDTPVNTPSAAPATPVTASKAPATGTRTMKQEAAPAPIPVEAPAPAAAAVAPMVSDTPAAPTSTPVSDATAQPSASSAPAVQDTSDAASSNAETLNALRQGGPYVMPVLLLVLAGLAVCTLLAVRRRRAEQNELQAQANDMKHTFWSADSLRQGMQTLDLGSPFRYIAELSLNAAENNNDKLYKKISRRAWVGQVIQHAKDVALAAAEQGAPSLMPIAAAAVVIGLLGAAWATLILPAATGTPLDAFAIGEGAAMLIFGFAVGMYAMTSYNTLLVRNEPGTYQIRAFSRDLQKALTAPVEQLAADRLLARAGAR